MASTRIPGNFSAGVARYFSKGLDHAFWRTTVDGTDHIPATGPVILAGNHTGLADGPAVQGASTRGVHFIIKQELTRGFGKILLMVGQIPVDRGSGHVALERSLQLLERGRVVGIFPEGTRGAGRMTSIHAGVGWLAVHSGAPVVPFACLGTRRQGEKIGIIPPPGRKIAVSFGAPVALHLDPEASDRDRVASALETIRVALAAHVKSAQERTGITLPTDTGRKDRS
jgi:1-acyl-sn-glycerol-3-phosphate acyltransferase